MSSATITTMDAACEIVVRVLASHGICDLKSRLGLLSDALLIAAGDEAVSVASTKGYRKEFDQGEELIAELSRVVDTLEHRSNAHLRYYMGEGPVSFEAAFTGVRQLLETEKSYHATRPEPEAFDRARPLTAKGEGTRLMREILVELDVMDAWACSNVIADLLIEAGIDAPPKRKVVKALYDKINRM